MPHNSSDVYKIFKKISQYRILKQFINFNLVYFTTQLSTRAHECDTGETRKTGMQHDYGTNDITTTRVKKTWCW